VKRFKRLDLGELLSDSKRVNPAKQKKHLDYFCASDTRDFSGEVLMLLGMRLAIK
jgi:hypothetical protein